MKVISSLRELCKGPGPLNAVLFARMIFRPAQLPAVEYPSITSTIRHDAPLGCLGLWRGFGAPSIAAESHAVGRGALQVAKRSRGGGTGTRMRGGRRLV